MDRRGLVPMLSALGLGLILLPRGVYGAQKSLPRWIRALAFGAVGYLVIYITGYLGHMAYYGNLWQGGEASAAIAVSDWALLGVLPGLVLGWRVQGMTDEDAWDSGWYLLWALAFGCASLTALGQGWFLQFMPQRFIVVLGLPIAVIMAIGLDMMTKTRPLVSRAIYGGILCCGVVSILVTWTVTYGPWGHDSLQRDYPWTRYAFMTEADGDVLFQVG